MDQIKEAFNKVKQDIDSLGQELDSLKKGMTETREKLIEICDLIHILNKKVDVLDKKESETKEYTKEIDQTQEQEKQTTPTDNPAHLYDYEGLKSPNMDISTGNHGVPADRQTDRQTDQHILQHIKTPEKTTKEDFYPLHLQTTTPLEAKNLNSNMNIDNAVKILDSLDSIKKELRLKFKRLTDQEFLVFSAIYQLEEELGHSDYKSLSEKLNLTESSIRDYVVKIIKKGIPVEKKRINNKTIHLFISKNLKKIVSLPTILQLRDL